MPQAVTPPDHFRVYGVTLSSDAVLDVPLPRAQPPADVAIHVTREAPSDLDLDALEPLHVEGRGRDGRPDFAFYAVEGGAIIHIARAMDFHLSPDRIVVHVTRAKHAYVLEIALFGLVMSLWLEMRGRLTLHASTVVIDGAAVAFSGSRGRGKSSTAAAMVAAGHPLLADDLLALDVTDDGVIAHPGYPQIRMWPEQAEHFTGHRDHPAFHRGHDKRRVVLDERFGSFVGEATPLRRVYLPRRAETADAPAIVRRLPPRHAMRELLEQSFLVPELSRFGLQARRLPDLSRLLETVDVCEITVPNGLEHLPRIEDAIHEDLARVR